MLIFIILFFVGRFSVFVWGWGGDFSFGQGALGLGNKQSQKRPVELKLPNDAKIDQISAGHYHSLAKTGLLHLSVY